MLKRYIVALLLRLLPFLLLERCCCENAVYHDLVKDMQLLITLKGTETKKPVLLTDLQIKDETKMPVQQMLIEAAYADSRGWLYGGAVAVNGGEQLQEIQELADFAFGRNVIYDTAQEQALSASALSVVVLDAMEKNLDQVEGPPWPAQVLRVHGMIQFDDFIATCNGTVVQLSSHAASGGSTEVVLSNLNDIFRKYLMDLRRANSKVSYVIDIKKYYSIRTPRLDATLYIDTAASAGIAATPQQYFIDIVRKIRAVKPDAEIHALTDDQPGTASPVWKQFTNMGVKIHHRGELPARMVWMGMVQTNLLVIGRSTFAFTPGVLNGKCVAYMPFIGQLGVMRNWVADIDVTEEYVRSCLFPSLKKTSWGEHDLVPQLDALFSKSTPGVPALVVDMRTDGAGAQSTHLLFAAALAHNRGWLFGGGIRVDESGNQHHENISDVTTFLFGRHVAFAADQDAVLKSSKFPIIRANHISIDTLSSAQKPNGVIRVHVPTFKVHFNFEPRMVNVPLYASDPQSKDFIAVHALDDFFPNEFIDKLRQQILNKISRDKLLYAPNKLSVALHVRRGRDVNAGFHLDRYSPDEFYFDMMDRIRAVHPDADFHVFSSLEGTATAKDFQPYVDRGAAVHLEEDVQTIEAWSHMIVADIFVMAKSSFSHVPAFFNTGCVIYTPRELDPGVMEHWMSEKTATPEKLSMCGKH